MNLSYMWLVLILQFIHPSMGLADKCQPLKNTATETSALEYMRQHSLILPDDEQNFPDIGVQIKWGLVGVKPASGGYCYVIMGVCDYSGPAKTCTDGPIEVIGLDTKASPLTFEKFEKIYSVPKKVIAKIGSREATDLSYYYVSLTGKSALNATKSFVSGAPYYGFSGIAVLGTKASFDPTSDRNWKISEAKFDLRRGMTAEVLDVQAWQLDGLDGSGAKGYWDGCQRPTDGKRGKCLVAPWDQAYVRELLPAK